jgi:hypothetical protein
MTTVEKAAQLTALAIGTLCTLTRDDREPEIEARVIAQYLPAGDGRVHETHFEPRDPDDALMHGTIIIFEDTLASPSGLWTFGDVVHEPEAEDEPKALALNLPRGAAWLMAEAKTLDNEAERYGANHSYGSPLYNIVNALHSSASSLRAAVGFALLIESEAQ